MRTKIKSLEQKTYQNKPNGFKVTLEDGTFGNLVEKDSDTGLREGDTVEATVVDYVSKSKGTHSNLITLKLVSETQQKSSETETKATPAKVPTTSLLSLKAQCVIKAMEFSVNAFIGDKITWDKIQPTFKELTGYLIDGIEECNKG